MKRLIVPLPLLLATQACGSPTQPLFGGYEDRTAGGLLSLDVSLYSTRSLASRCPRQSR